MVSLEQIEEIQAAWGHAVVQVGAASSWAQAHNLAAELVREHYLLDGSLLFCPTKAAEQPFRASLEAAVSYFVGGDAAFEEDKGFALEPWASVRFDNEGIVCRGDVAMAMGHYYFAGKDGSELKVEYSFVYVCGPQGRLMIQLHHSALPYSG